MNNPMLIADSGSTKTEWRLVLPDGNVVAVRTDGINPYYQSTDVIATTLAGQLVPALSGKGVADVHFYGAGCATPDASQRVADALRSVLPNLGNVAVSSDMLGAARATCGHSAGVACILGTGSNAAYFNGEQLVSPGYSLGFWLGDEGSGGHLGKQLVVQYLHGLLPPDLTDAFRQQHPTLDRLVVLDHAYQRPFPNRYFAQFAPFLGHYVAHPFVQALVEGSFADFLRLYVRRVLPPDTDLSVNFVGSIGFYFREQLDAAARAQHLRVGRVLAAPIDALVAYHR